MTNKKKVSIVTVTYNSARTITDTIESVLNQTYPDIEYWIVDGLSTDGTTDIIKSYEEKFEGRLHWISEQDQGIYDAMNKGVRNATGDIIGILNSDDFFSSNDVIARAVEAFSDDVEAIFGDVHFVKDNNLQKCVRYYSGSIFRPSLIQYGFIPPHPSLYIRRSVYEQYGYYDPNYKISADFELIARLACKHQVKMKYVHLDFVTMRTGGASTQDFASRMLGTKEDLKACKQIGIKTNWMKIFLKYPIKIFESIFIRK